MHSRTTRRGCATRMTYAPAWRLSHQAGLHDQAALRGYTTRRRYRATTQCRGTKMRYRLALRGTTDALPRSGGFGSNAQPPVAREGLPGYLCPGDNSAPGTGDQPGCWIPRNETPTDQVTTPRLIPGVAHSGIGSEPITPLLEESHH